MSAFAMLTCHVGAEAFLRRAVPAATPGFRPAFARPGLLTFKSDAPVSPDAPRPHPLARGWGLGAGSARDVEGVAVAVRDLPERFVLQVIPGEAGPPGHVPPAVLSAWQDGASQVDAVLREALGERVFPGAEAAPGQAVLDVIVRPSEPWVLGWHRHGGGRGPLPGGRWPLVPPPDAPSRAWAKLEELIAWSGVALGDGARVLEIGCAPGGATLALLDRGCVVVGVDPQPMALPARVADRPFRHLRRAIEGVPRDELPDAAEWIVLDASEAAPVALHALQRLVPRYNRGLKGALVTLKLNEWDLAEGIPAWVAQVRGMGFRRVEAANLPAFRQEIGLVALR